MILKQEKKYLLVAHHENRGKSLSKRSPVPLGTSFDKVTGDYWMFVNNLSVKPC